MHQDKIEEKRILLEQNFYPIILGSIDNYSSSEINSLKEKYDLILINPRDRVYELYGKPKQKSQGPIISSVSEDSERPLILEEIAGEK